MIISDFLSNYSDQTINRILINNNILGNNISKEGLYSDLSFFNDNNSLIDKIDQSITPLGTHLLKETICYPITDIQILKKRQELCKFLSTNKAMNNKILDKLANINNNINDIKWFWEERTEEEETLLKSLYFQNKYLKLLNKNSVFLQVYQYYNNIAGPLISIVSPIVMIILPYIIVRYITKIHIPFKPYLKVLLLYYKTMIISKQYTNIVLSIIIPIGSYIHNLFNIVNICKNIHRITKQLHKRLNVLKDIIDFYKETNTMFDEYRTVIPKVNDNIEIYINKEFNYFSNKGHVSFEYNRIINSLKMIQPYIKYIANIDMYYGISSLMNKGNKYMFTYSKYGNNLKISNMWYPLINMDNIVTNSVNMKKNKNILITGPNAGGKSTYIRNIILNILLSQTIGISSSKSCEIPIYNLIRTHIDIPDKEGHESLFEAEINRFSELMNDIENNEKNGFNSFIAVDEIFNSTNYIEGVSASYSICKELSKKNKLNSIITTHFNYLTKLEKTTKGKFKNYRVIINRKDKDIIFKYKISKGISNDFIALDLLEKRDFNKEIIKNAQSIKLKLDNYLKL